MCKTTQEKLYCKSLFNYLCERIQNHSYMKKTLNILVALSFLLIMGSCGGSVKIDPNLSKEEVQAVEMTEKSLSRGDKIENYKVVKGKLPLALLETEYKSYRDQVYKAQIDYVNCVKRGLDDAAQKNLGTLEAIQQSIVENSKNLEAQSPEYIFVLADVKERSRKDGNLTGFISVFDTSTLQQVDLIQVTTPLYKNAIMITQALEGTLANPAKADPSPTDLHPENQVVQFIFSSHPK